MAGVTVSTQGFNDAECCGSHLVSQVRRHSHVGGIGCAHGDDILRGVLWREARVHELAHADQQVGATHAKQAGSKTDAQQLEAVPLLHGSVQGLSSFWQHATENLEARVIHL